MRWAALRTAGLALCLALAGATSAADAAQGQRAPGVAAASGSTASAAAVGSTAAPQQAASGATCRVLDPELQGGTYEGGCQNGLAQGQGVARGASGAWYRGGFEAGRKSGHGTKLFANGDGYTGGWQADQRAGEGRYEYGPHSPWRGDVYQGGWANDRREGAGTYIFFPSGDRFSTRWQAGQPLGEGTTTATRRKRAAQDLAPVLGQVGLRVCSTSTEGAGPGHRAQGVVRAVVDDRIQVELDGDSPVLRRSADPQLNPRWEVMTDWRPCGGAG
ncbi:hypothetical protein [Castellaniella sp.]|uniref:hypothetical protein n=1 Tax=Castellaniella sp. TaxID=1955812 RepID=UPI0035604F82